MRIPARLEWRREAPEGAAWLERLPGLVSECAQAWSLAVGEPFGGGAMSLVLPVVRAGGGEAVLKVHPPGRDASDEAAALALWDGDGAVRLLAHDRERHALLLERCRPGTPLDDAGDEALGVAVAILRRLWRPAPEGHSFRPLREEAARWSACIPADWEQLGRPFERELVDAALDALRQVDERDPVVLHGDFHGGSVLRAQRAPWLAIDPIPLVGERAFDAGSLLRDRTLGRTGGVRACLDRIAFELELDREPVRGFAIANALSWGISRSKLELDLVECARSLLR